MSARPETITDGDRAGLRRMATADLDRVHLLETYAYAFPWSKAIFRDCLKPGYDNWVLAEDGQVIGYGILCYGACEAHVLNLCVHPEYRGRQLGRRLLRQLLARADHCGAQRVFLEVRPSNQPARNLYLREGFREVGRRPGYYPDRNGREDALVLSLELDPAVGSQGSTGS